MLAPNIPCCVATSENNQKKFQILLFFENYNCETNGVAVVATVAHNVFLIQISQSINLVIERQGIFYFPREISENKIAMKKHSRYSSIYFFENVPLCPKLHLYRQ